MWRHLALPLHVAPLLLVGLIAILLSLASYSGPFGWPLGFILGSWFFKYGFVLLDHVAEGRPGAPVLSIENANPLGETRPWLYLAVGLTYYGLTALCGDALGDGVATALRTIGLLALPAVIATHSITGSFFRALDPRAAVAMIRRLGPAYGYVLVVVLACGLAGRWVLLDAIDLPLVLQLAVLMLLWLMMFATLGGVLHDRRQAIGYEPEQSPERRAADDQRHRDRERDRFADQLFHETRSGAVGNALATIRARAAAGTSALDEYTWIYARVATWPDVKLANRVAQELLPLQLAAKRTGQALKVVNARLLADPTFRPATAEQLVQLALLARAAGNLPLARRLIEDFDQHYPGDPTRARITQLEAMLKR